MDLVSKGDRMKTWIVALSLTVSAAAFAGTSATLFIKGQIAQQLNISVAPESIASSLDLTSTQSNTKVAVVTEKSNSNTGYKVSISSQNLGVLKNNQSTFV